MVDSLTFDDFEKQFEASLEQVDFSAGSLIQARVLSIEKNLVLLDAGLKSESIIPLDEFKNADGSVDLKVGDEVQVVLEIFENGYGETLLSREKAKKYEAWKRLETAYETEAIIEGVINGKVKGGFTVEVGDFRTFLPGSLVDIRPVKDITSLEGKVLKFKVLKLDKKRNNVVVSRRAVLSAGQEEEREKLLASLKEGDVLNGIVKNLTDYGAFVDLGGVDGLLHITDMAWKRVRHPSEIVSVGDDIEVVVLKFEKDRNRVSLGLKQLTQDPWGRIVSLYQKGMKVKGRVTNLTEYGCFVGLEDGVEGLVHVSEMGWSSKNVHPSKLVSIGDEVEVIVLDLDVERRRISLGMKQCSENPWKIFEATAPRGTIVEGEVNSVTDFGLFVSLSGDIDGLVHFSDLSWEEHPETFLANYKKGDKVRALVLQVDPERERVSLGIKQLEKVPAETYLESHPIGSNVSAVVTEINHDKMRVEVSLAKSVRGDCYFRDLEEPIEAFSAGAEKNFYILSVTETAKGAPTILLSQGEVKTAGVADGGKEPSSQVSQKPISAMAAALLAAQSADKTKNSSGASRYGKEKR